MRFFLFFLLLILSHAKAELLYVSTDQDEVKIVDGETQTLVGTILVDHLPYGLAASPNGDFVYVANVGSDTISVISTESQSLVSTILLETGAVPVCLAVTPDGKILCCTNNGNHSFMMIDTTTYDVVKSIEVGLSPMGVAIHPEGKSAYVTHMNESFISVVDLEKQEVVTQIQDVEFATDVQFVEGGDKAFVTGFHGMIYVVDFKTHGVIEKKEVDKGVGSIVVLPDGLTTYHSNQNEDAILMMKQSESQVISIGVMPLDLAMSHDKKKIYVAHAEGIGVVHPQTLQIEDVFLFNGMPCQMILKPLPTPPSIVQTVLCSLVVSGSSQKNVFLAQKDRFNMISWEVPKNGQPIEYYRILRDGKKIAKIKGKGPFEFEDHQVKKNQTYGYTVQGCNKNGVVITGFIDVTTGR